MAIMDKLLFWRKKEQPLDLGLGGGRDLGLGADLGLGGDQTGIGMAGDMGAGYGTEQFGADAGFGAQPNYSQQQPSAARQRQQSYQEGAGTIVSTNEPETHRRDTQIYAVEKNMEIISSKLDVLKVSLESINQRLANLERIATADRDEARIERKRSW